MRLFSILSLVILFAGGSTAFAQDVDVVIDDFESYSSSSELQAVWGSVGEAGDTANSTFLTNPPDAVYTNYTGQAAVFDGTIGIGAGSVNEYQAAAFNVAPSATQNVELTVDLGHDALTSNKKLSLGLRGDAGIIELGYFNQLPVGPNGEFYQFAYRNVLFPGSTNWQPFSLSSALDQIHEVSDSAFHRFKVVISETDLTFSVDLFADGIVNATADYDEDTDIDVNDYLLAQRGDGTEPIDSALVQ